MYFNTFEYEIGTVCAKHFAKNIENEILINWDPVYYKHNVCAIRQEIG